MKNLSIDIETYSSADLSKSGVYRYCESPDFEILLFSYSADGGEVVVVDIASGESIPKEIVAALSDATVTKWAFNAQFERICLSRYIGSYLNPQGWRCTMVWAATLGLPLSLEGVGAVLKLEKQKLQEGKALIKYFCMPCAPTKTNGGRQRNLPEHDLQKWQQFKDYNTRDVETEMEIQAKLAKFPVLEAEWENYRLDQIINDRGVALDMEFVNQAITCDEISRDSLYKRLQSITGLDNPNSVQQMRGWLADNGMETDSLDKAAVSELLENAPPKLKEVLLLRQEISKSSVRKYAAMENVVGSDGRARGLIQFYGANRTGRFAGRLIQVQNLPRNYMANLKDARDLVKSGRFDELEMLFDSTSTVLSELIRTAFVPKKNTRFIVADFSSIERVVLAWLAGEKWVLDAYIEKRDLYSATASQMFGVPLEKIDKKGPLRQKGKVADLACIAEGQLVLTDKGLIPIENVTLNLKVWDGISWVSHEGVIYKGEGEVMEYEGLIATPDHLVWVVGATQPIQLGEAAATRAHLVQTGADRREIRLGGDYTPNTSMVGQKMEQVLCIGKVHRLQKNTVDTTRKLNKRGFKRLPNLFKTKTSSQMVRETLRHGKTTMRKPKKPFIPLLWSTRDKIQIPFGASSRTLHFGKARLARQKFANGPHRQQWALPTGEFALCNTERKQLKQVRNCSNKILAKVLALLLWGSNQKVVSWNDSKRDNSGRKISGTHEKKELATYKRTARLYDIRNAGVNNRFTVSNRLVHNCGYGGSVGALKAMGALQMGIAEEELRPLVKAWRQSNPNIVQLWWDIDKAVIAAVIHKASTQTHGIRFTCKSGMLFITLPSSRNLVYVKPKLAINQFGLDSVTYEGIGATKKWERIESYGPKFVENIVQAIARDILVEAITRLEREGLNVVMHVHDEVVLEVPIETSSVDKVCKIMAQSPEWAEGLTLSAEGFECDFYQKD